MAALAGVGYTFYKTYFIKEWSYYLFIPIGMGTLIFGTFFFLMYFRYSLFRKEILNHELSLNNKEPIVSIRNVYRRLMTLNININWGCATIYVLCLFGILGTYVAAYFINLINYQINDFTYLTLGNGNNITNICVWTFAGICFALLPIQFIANIINYKRRNDIDAYYGKLIIDETLIAKYKKTANIRGAIIFTLLTIILGIVLIVAFLILRKSKRAIL